MMDEARHEEEENNNYSDDELEFLDGEAVAAHPTHHHESNHHHHNEEGKESLINHTNKLSSHEEEERKILNAILSRRPHVIKLPGSESITSLDGSDDSGKPSGLERDGYLFKKQMRTNVWNRYYVHFVPELLEIRYYKTKEDFYKGKTPRGRIQVTWLTALRTKKEDKLVKTQIKIAKKVPSKGTEVCTWRLRVFSPKRVYTLSAEKDEEAEEWMKAVRAVLKATYTEEEAKERRQASQKIEPLYQKQIKQQLEQYRLVLQALSTAGIFDLKPTSHHKKKEGYLELAKDNGAWKKYYFVLWKHSLSYFNLEDKTIPRGIISLESIQAILPDDKEGDIATTLHNIALEDQSNNNNNNNNSSGGSILSKSNPLSIIKNRKQGSTSLGSSPVGSPASSPRLLRSESVSTTFTILTPVRRFHLRAKHHSAMADWILTVQSLKKDSLPQIVQRDEEDITGAPIDLAAGEKITLEYTVSGKKKTHKMKKKSLVIGRSSKADLYLDKDSKVSRNHCKIELTSNSVPVLYDLGSLSGTSVNGKKVTHIALRNGDKIVVGDTHIVFKVNVGKSKVSTRERRTSSA